MIDSNDYDYDYDDYDSCDDGSFNLHFMQDYGLDDDDIDTLVEAGVVYDDFREDLCREQARQN